MANDAARKTNTVASANKLIEVTKRTSGSSDDSPPTGLEKSDTGTANSCSLQIHAGETIIKQSHNTHVAWRQPLLARAHHP